MRKLLILLLLLLIAGKITMIAAIGPAPLQRDSLGYWQLSTLVLSGDVLLRSAPIAYRTPGYPWFLAFIRFFSGPYALAVIVAVQAAMAFATVAIWSRMAVRMTQLPRAMLWTLLVALPAISASTYVATVLSEILFLFLLTLHFQAVAMYTRHPSLGRAVWAGITFGSTLLTRPIVQLLWVADILFVLVIHFRERRQQRNLPVYEGGVLHQNGNQGARQLYKKILHMIAAAFVVLMMAAPWLARNTVMFGQPSLTQFIGRNLWIVTFQDGSGAALDFPESDSGQRLQRRLENVDAADDWPATWAVSNALVRSGLNDAQADRLMRSVAMDAIEAEQEWFSFKALRRSINFWRTPATELPRLGAAGNFRGQKTWQYSRPKARWLIRHRLSQQVWANTAIAAVALVALLILLINRRTRPAGIWMALTLAYFSVVTGILEIPDYRYRMITEPILAAVVGSAIAVLLSKRRRPAATDAKLSKLPTNRSRRDRRASRSRTRRLQI